jgi:hypothetical protein
VLAGRWYPGDPKALDAAVAGYLAAGARGDALPLEHVRAIVSPHAGYVYSGATAGLAFASAARDRYARAIVVGPAHRVAFRGISGGDFSAYETPTATVRVDRAGLAALEEQGLVGFVPEAHAAEHCLEIMLPFIARALGDVPILPLLVGHVTDGALREVLASALNDDDLLVISSDLSHFDAYDLARRHDLATLDAIAEGRAAELDGSDACGYRGIIAATELAKARGWRTVVLGYENSGDTAGDNERVVGYGAVAMGV